MKKLTKSEISFFQSEKLASCSEIFHFFSTRNGGVSSGVFESLNFGIHHGEHENMKTNLGLLANTFNLNTEKFVIPKQTHSNVVGIVDELNYTESFENTDALITKVPSMILAIKTADCVPILLFDPVKKAIGAVHSGWRGTAQNIIGETIAEMTRVFGSSPSTLIAAIGPCISQSNYEVGVEVVRRIEQITTDRATVLNFSKTAAGKALLNLTQANLQLLIKAGLHITNIETSELCTFSLNNDFFSARRDGSITGRMINGICINL